MAWHDVVPIVFLLTVPGAIVIVAFGWGPRTLTPSLPSSLSPLIRGDRPRNIGSGRAPKACDAGASRTATAGPLAVASSPHEGDGTHIIEAWLATHLPTLSASDLQDYAARLRDDGFTSTERLNGINAGESGMLEDLYFMKKGHRRTLIKKMGIVRAMRGIEGNRIVRDGDDDTVEGDEQAPDPNQGASNRRGRAIADRDTSIEDWLAEQSRMIDEEKRRLAELGGEDRLEVTSEDIVVGRDGGAQAEDISDGTSDEEQWEEEGGEKKEEVGDKDDIFSNERGEGLFDDLVSRYHSLNVVADDNQGTASKQARRVEELKRDFLNRLRPGGDAYAPILESKDADMNFLDDFAARYQYLDLASRGDGGRSDKEARRLDDLKRAFFNRVRANDGRALSAIDKHQDTFLLDDFVARYQSLGVAPREDLGAKDKESRRLEELKQVFDSSLQSKEGFAPTLGSEDKDNDLLDDFISRYQHLGMVSRGDVGMGDKEAHRLEELKSAFLNRVRANGGRSGKRDGEEMDFLDDFTAHYKSLVSRGKTGIKDKEARRLGELRQQFSTKPRAGGNYAGVVANEEMDLMDDFLARYQPLDMASQGDDGTKEKEARRLEELRRSFFYGGQRGGIRKTEESEDAYRSQLDDFASRYDGLKEVSTNRDGTAEKERRRLEAMKRAILKSQKLKKSAYDSVEEPLRLDLLKQATREETAEEFRRPEKKERQAEVAHSKDGVGAKKPKKPCKTKEERRLEDLDKSFREAHAARRLEEEKMEKLLADAKKDVGVAGSDCGRDVGISRRTKECRRLEELEESFRKRRRARMVEEERMERMLMKVKMEAATDTSTEKGPRSKDDNGNCHGPNIKPLAEEVIGMDLDDFFDQRRVISRSLSTTMPLTGGRKRKEKDGSAVLSAREVTANSNDHDDITVNNIKEWKNLSLSTTMPPSNRGAVIRPLTNEEGSAQGKGAVEGERMDKEECWDITRGGFAERRSLSLATTLPPANTRETILRAHCGKESDASGGDASEVYASEGENEPFYDITRNLFPEISGRISHSSQGRAPPSMPMQESSAFLEEEKSEMNNRKPTNLGNLKAGDWEKEAMTDLTPVTRRSFPDRLPTNLPMEEEKSEMNDRRPLDQTAGKAKADRKARLVGVLGVSKDSSPGSSAGACIAGGLTAEEAEAARPQCMSEAGEVAGKGSALGKEEKSGMDSGKSPISTIEAETGRVQRKNAAVTTLTSNVKETKSLAAVEDTMSEDVTREGEKTEMNERKSSNLTAETNAVRVKANTPAALEPEERKFQSNRRQSVFSESERSEMNGRPPPPVSERASRWSRMPNSDESPLDIISRFPGVRPSMSSMGGSSEESKKQRSPLPRDEDENYVDLVARFPNDRPSMSVNTGTKKVHSTAGSYKESKGNVDKSLQNKDGAFVGITQSTGHFAGGQPSTYVNTVPSSHTAMKTRGTLVGSYEESKRPLSQRDEDENYVDSVARFPGTKKVHSTAGSCKESKESDEAHVNTGTKKSGEGYTRDVAYNFSHDRVSLIGHSARNRFNIRSKSEKNKYLDKNMFSSSLWLDSRLTVAASTNAKDSSAGKDSEYLDTPRAFAKDLDMAPPSIFEADASKKRISIHTAGRGNDVVDFLDVQTFSSNLRSSTITPPQKFSLDQEENFLDKPRPFQSNVDMVSSNTSGTRFKRSSDVPPEEKRIRDHYDIATAPMPDIDRMAKTKVIRPSNDMKGEEPFKDITRIPLSTLERTSSAVKDANSASKARPKGATVSVPGSESGQSDDGSDANVASEESSFEEIMYWLLAHLPHLQEEDAITYFNDLLDDGFDSIENLEELMEKDLHFMKEGHRRALLRSIRETDEALLDRHSGLAFELDGFDLQDERFEDITHSPPSGSSAATGNADEPEIYDVPQNKFEDRMTLAAAPTSLGTPDAPFDETKTVPEKSETSIAEQNSVVEEREEQGSGSKEEGSAEHGEPFMRPIHSDINTSSP